MNASSIIVTDKKIGKKELKEQCDRWFGDMVKIVVDIEREILGIGGELHADGEEALIREGSLSKNIWGINFYPWNHPDHRIDYTALINIRPHDDNPSMDIMDEAVKIKIKAIVEEMVLRTDEKLV